MARREVDVTSTALNSTKETPAQPAASSSAEAHGAVLSVVEGPNKGQVFRVEGEIVTVGRGLGNTVVIPNGSISRTHARLEWRERDWYVVDLNSTNGTRVNGVRVTDECRVGRVASLEFGGCKVFFRDRDVTVQPNRATRAIRARAD